MSRYVTGPENNSTEQSSSSEADSRPGNPLPIMKTTLSSPWSQQPKTAFTKNQIICKTITTSSEKGNRGSTLVKALRYKSEGRWFESRWCHWNFSLTQSFRSHYGPGVDSASKRNECQEYFLGVKTAGA